MICQECKKAVEYIAGESEFCSECGAELIPSADSTDNITSKKSESVSDNIVWNTLLSVLQKTPTEEKNKYQNHISTPMPQAGENRNLSIHSQQMAEILEQKDDDFFFEKTRNNLASNLVRIEYNKNIFFISEFQSIIKLRITPLKQELSNILLFLIYQRNDELFRRQIPITEILQVNKPFYLTIPFNPGCCIGNISLTFYVGCQFQQGIKYFQFQTEHVVYDPNQSSATLSNQIVINQRFDATQAADINYQDNLGDAVKELIKKNLTSNELINQLNNRLPDYQVQYLSESSWRPEDIFVSGNLYHADSLILEWNGYKILLLSKIKTILGRTAENSDLLVRAGGGKLSPREYPNQTVSRVHAELCYMKDHVLLIDHSSYGTYVNGNHTPKDGIKLPSKAIIEFGDIHWKMSLQLCSAKSARNICQTCRMEHVKSLVFRRTDNEKKCYLFVWQCCELGMIFEELTDWDIFYRNNAFFIRTPEQEFFYLRPGHAIKSNNQTINVTYFQQ